MTTHGCNNCSQQHAESLHTIPQDTCASIQTQTNRQTIFFMRRDKFVKESLTKTTQIKGHTSLHDHGDATRNSEQGIPRNTALGRACSICQSAPSAEGCHAPRCGTRAGSPGRSAPVTCMISTLFISCHFNIISTLTSTLLWA